MPLQANGCVHPRDCDCDECLREYVEHFAALKRFDDLAARDPEPQARAEFAAWASQAEDVTCPEGY